MKGSKIALQHTLGNEIINSTDAFSTLSTETSIAQRILKSVIMHPFLVVSVNMAVSTNWSSDCLKAIPYIPPQFLQSWSLLFRFSILIINFIRFLFSLKILSTYGFPGFFRGLRLVIYDCSISFLSVGLMWL